MRPLLVLRPEPGAGYTAAAARAAGLRPIVSPLFTVVPCDWDAPDPATVAALLLTSANAVRHAGDALARYRAVPAWTVGAATARAARDAGLLLAGEGREGVACLTERMVAAGVPAALHLAGRDHHDAIAPGLLVDRRIVYRADARDTLSPPGEQAVAAGCVALIHSARAGEALARLLAAEVRGRVTLVAISAGVATAAGAGWQALHVAAAPSDQAMLALAAELCQEAA